MSIVIQVIYFSLTAFYLYKVFQISAVKSVVVAIAGSLLSGYIFLVLLFQLGKTELRQYDPNAFNSKIAVGVFGGILTAVIFALILKFILKTRITKSQMINLFAVSTFISLVFAIASRYIK